MITLSTTTQSVEVVLGAAPTTPLRAVVSYGQHTTGSYTAGVSASGISGTSAVTVLSAPASGYERVVRGISIQNVDSSSATITVRLNDNGTYSTLCKVTILAGYLLGYDDDGWYVLNDTGARLGVGPTGATGAAGATGATGPQGPEGGSTTLTTKGDLLTRDASNLARLPVGTNGQYLAADSAETTGLKWTTPPTGAPASSPYVTVSADATLTNESVLTAGANISVTTGTGIVTVAATGLATKTPSYITLANTTDLDNERSLVVSSPLTYTDGGAGSTYTIGLTQGSITHNNLGGLTTGDPHTQYLTKATVTTSGDLLYGTGASAITRLGIGSTGQVLSVSGGLPAWTTPTTPAPVGAPYITVSSDGTLTNESVLTAGTGISLTTGTGTITASVNQGALTHNNLGGLTTGDPHTQYITKATATTAGDTLYATGASTIARLGIGTTGQVLTVSGGVPAWATPSSGVTDHGLLTGLGDDDHTQYLLKSTVTTSGDLLYGTGSAAITRLGIGSNGQVLTVSSGVPTWAAATGGVTDHGALTGLADDDHTKYIFVDPASSTRNVITPGGDYKALVVKNSATQSVNPFEMQNSSGTARCFISWQGTLTAYGLDASNRAITSVSDPSNAQDAATKAYADTKIAQTTLTTKGDLMGRSGSAATRIPVGTDGYFLKADSTNANGVAWATATFSSALTTKGDILVRDASADTRLPVGTNGYILSANSSTSTGLEWIANSGGGGGGSAPDFLLFNAGIF